MIGKTYFERGRPVTVLIRWGKGGGPRNVLIQREDGAKVVRPFRGLRKIKDPGAGAVTENHQSTKAKETMIATSGFESHYRGQSL
jgi:hypothetical protein